LRESAPALAASIAESDNLVSVAPPVSVPAEPVAAKPAQPPKKPGVKVIKKKKTDARTPEQVETDIAHAERRLNEISQQMGTPEVARDAEKLIALNDEYQLTESLLRNLYDEWDRVSQAATAPG